MTAVQYFENGRLMLWAIIIGAAVLVSVLVWFGYWMRRAVKAYEFRSGLVHTGVVMRLWNEFGPKKTKEAK